MARGIHVVRMPLPMRVAPVNCWVLDADDGPWIIDTGMAFDAGASWTYALRELGIVPTSIAGVIVTHFHPDHVGACDVLHELTGAPVCASGISVAQAPGVWGASSHEYHGKMTRHLAAHGMPAERLRELERDRAGMQQAVSCDALVAIAGDVLEIGDRRWQVIPTPGHADGHISLFDAAAGVFIAGDHLLEYISPAVGKFPDHDNNPLGRYMDSLRRVAQYDIRAVLPGHGAPFERAQERCEALCEHHESRLAACVEAAARAASTWEIARTVFGAHLHPRDERFAVTETLAHLALAQHRGDVMLHAGNDGRGVHLWQKV